MKEYRITTWLMIGVMISALLLSACSLLESSSASARTPERAISEAVHTYLDEQGTQSEEFEVVIEQLEDDFARVKIISIDPAVPGGFTGFLQRIDGGWSTLIVGSGFNSMELQSLGIPQSILPDGWIYSDDQALSDKPPASVTCPKPTAGTMLQTDETLAYCLLYPDSHTVVQLDSGNTEFVVGEVMNHIDPRVSVYAEELGNRSLEQYVDEFLAGFEGFEIERTDLIISGEEAVQLDGIPGQDFYRKVFIAHHGLVYQLQFAPYDPNLADTFPQAEQLHALVMNSFTFTIP